MCGSVSVVGGGGAERRKGKEGERMLGVRMQVKVVGRLGVVAMLGGEGGDHAGFREFRVFCGMEFWLGRSACNY